MIVADVLEEIGAAHAAIPEFAGRTYPWNAAKISPPAVVVDLPEKGTYDATYGRGSDGLTLGWMVLAGPPADRPTGLRVMGYISGSGPTSVKAALEAWEWTTCDQLTVVDFEVVVATMAAVQYLGVQFSAEVMGRGA